MAGLLLDLLLLLGGFLSTTTLLISFLAISVAIFSEMSFDSAAAQIVFSWAILPITVLFVAAAVCSAMHALTTFPLGSPVSALPDWTPRKLVTILVV